MPAIRSMLICGKSSARAAAVGLLDLRRAVRAAVELEDAIVEVLDAEAEARDAQLADRRQLGFGERAGLALERDLFGVRPRRRRAVSRVTSAASCCVERNDGVPPPK